MFQRTCRVFPDVARVLDVLGSSAGVLTDVPYGMPRRLVEADLAAVGLDAIAPRMLTSVEVGLRKPEPRGFESLAALLGCAPGQMLYAGNEAKDVAGAKAAGMAAALVWRGSDPVPQWGQDVTVSNLGELVPLMGAI
jgi:putative hydrolase of the HAD superfamily